MNLQQLACALVAIAALGCGDSKVGGIASASPDVVAPDGPLPVGARAPTLDLKLQDGKTVQLASLAGRQVLVYFYPKDDTRGCTIEAQGIKTAWDRFKEAGIEVYGVSTQDAASHQAFIQKYELPFPLVVDEDGSVAKAFGVPLTIGFAARQSFLIGKDGTIKAVWPDVDPKEHAEAVLRAASSPP